ncbi:hypothetical protein ABK040_000327 [Willaertia magna]
MPSYDVRNYIIRSIDFEKNPLSTFYANGVAKTYVDYYKERYNVSIKDLKQPLIGVTIKRRNQKKQHIFLIPELTYFCGIQPQLLRSISRDINNTMFKKSQFISTAVNSINQGKGAEEFKKWGLDISTTPKEVLTYQLLDPVKIQGGAKYELKQVYGSWKNDIKNCQLFEPKELNDWIVVYTADWEYYEFMKSFKRFGQNLGITFKNPYGIRTVTHDNSGEQYINALNKSSDFKNSQIVVCILPDQNIKRYSNIKQFVQSDSAKICQCVQANNLNKPSIITNVILQIQAKLNSILWNAKVVMGKGSDFKGAVSLSINSKHSMYTSFEFSNVKRREVSSKVVNSIIKGLEDYHERYYKKNMPQILLVYREGVSDGEIEKCMANEVEPLVNYLGDRTKLIYILVSKNNNTRFVQNGKNLPVGSIVEQLQRANSHEFFIISTSVSENSGVTKPIRYQLLFNNTDYTTEAIYTMTYKQCHMYYNWPGTVKVPASLMYSSKCLQSLSVADYNPELRKNLFFL